MALVRFANVGGLGLIADGFPHELPQDAWSTASNVRFLEGYAAKFGGYDDTLGTPTVAPYGVFYAPTNSADAFVYCGTAAAYIVVGSTHTEITRGSGAYTASATSKWTGGMLGGILVVTNDAGDDPQFIVPSASNDFADLTNWPASTSCKAIRVFRSHLIAMDVTESSTNYPDMVRWSQPAEPGTVPSSWDYTDTTKDAGRTTLADGAGAIIDGMALNDQFYLFKRNTTYRMTYVGAPFIFSFEKVTDRSGILARNCAVETPLGLVVLTQGDVVLQRSSGLPQSIIDGRNRRYLFESLSETIYAQSFLLHNEDRSEVWVCYPTTASTSGCDRALVWNYAADTWTVRTLPNVHAGATGSVSADTGGLGVWSDYGATAWSAISGTWNQGGAQSPSTVSVLLASGANTKLFVVDATEQQDGADMTCLLERTGLSLDDPSTIKLVRGIRPRVDGVPTATLDVYVGASMDVDESPSWSGPFTHTVGSTHKIDCLVTGRYLAVRFRSTDSNVWRLKSFDLDVEPLGQF